MASGIQYWTRVRRCVDDAGRPTAASGSERKCQTLHSGFHAPLACAVRGEAATSARAPGGVAPVEGATSASDERK